MWQLVKLPKTAKVQDLHEATVVALGKSQFPEDMEKFGFYPVQRKTVDGVCVKLGDRLLEVGSLDLLLSALQPEHLQVIQLIFAREAPFPSDVPEGPKAFPTCGICLPVMGTSYQNNGPYPIPEYNFARNVFPPSGEYPYGSTVRSHAGQKQSVGGFGASVLHEDAQYTETMTADASIIQELVSRAADFPKLWNRDVEVGLQARLRTMRWVRPAIEYSLSPPLCRQTPSTLSHWRSLSNSEAPDRFTSSSSSSSS